LEKEWKGDKAKEEAGLVVWKRKLINWEKEGDTEKDKTEEEEM